MLNVTIQNSVLLVIDVQQALFERPTPVYQGEQLLQNLNALIDAWRGVGGMVVFLQHDNHKMLPKHSPGWRLHPQLHRMPDDVILHKTHGNAFQDTPLEQILEAHGIQRVVVTGLVSEGCVRATCLGGVRLGYEVVLVADAHSSYRRDAASAIDKWNRELSQQQVQLINTDELTGLIRGGWQ